MCRCGVVESASGDVASCCGDDGFREVSCGSVNVVVEEYVPVGCFKFFVELFPVGLAEVPDVAFVVSFAKWLEGECGKDGLVVCDFGQCTCFGLVGPVGEEKVEEVVVASWGADSFCKVEGLGDGVGAASGGGGVVKRVTEPPAFVNVKVAEEKSAGEERGEVGEFCFQCVEVLGGVVGRAVVETEEERTSVGMDSEPETFRGRGLVEWSGGDGAVANVDDDASVVGGVWRGGVSRAVTAGEESVVGDGGVGCAVVKPCLSECKDVRHVGVEVRVELCEFDGMVHGLDVGKEKGDVVWSEWSRGLWRPHRG